MLSVQRWACRFPLMYELWRECCSLAFRIRHLHEIGVADEGLRLNCTLGFAVRLQGAAARGRSESIQNLRQRNPWATLADCAVYLQGFGMGVVFLLDNLYFGRGTRQPAESATTSGSPVITDNLVRTAQPGTQRHPAQPVFRRLTNIGCTSKRWYLKLYSFKYGCARENSIRMAM